MPDAEAVYLLGDVTVDITLTVPSFPREGGDAFARERSTAVGGCGSNVGLVLARLGRRVHLIANVGDDEWGRGAIEVLSRQGVDVAGVSLDRDAPTHLTVIIVSGGGERTIIGHRGASAAVGPRPMLGPAPTAPQAFVVSGYALFGDARARQAKDLIEALSATGTPVVLDLPTELPEVVQARVRALLPRVRFVVVGAAEITALTGLTDPLRAAASLADDQRTAVVTLGAAGCLAVGSDGSYRVPGIPARAVDATGSGDAFIAAFTAGWLDGLPLPDLLVLANGFGAAAAERLGAGTVLPGPTEVRDLLRRCNSLPDSVAAWLASTPAGQDQRGPHQG